MDFDKAYKALNDKQRQAVDEIEGPLLVIAGPGTGKTQLLSARVARIMQQTDTLPQNILCLTFTENGALNMRERLTQFIGQAAYDVQISTYHAFGREIIGRFPEYFAQLRLQSPIEKLGQHEIISQLVEQMSYLNPLKQTQYHLGDLISTISDIKRALLTSESLHKVADENLAFLNKTNTQIKQIFADFTSMPRNVTQALQYFEQVQSLLAKYDTSDSTSLYGSLRDLLLQELTEALELSETEKTKPLTKWKNKWLVKDVNNTFILDGTLAAKRIHAIADVLDAYQAELTKRGLYDFDDMILQAVYALQNNDDLKFTLQEQYLYILLDEFQDTNAAQAKLVQLLSDNPVSEGRPNVMAVGDDDQAIYAFQGAHISNMLDFAKNYRDTTVISLDRNYRSHTNIISSAQNISSQIAQRLTDSFKDVTKNLIASNESLPPHAQILRQDFMSSPAQSDWIAKKINNLISDGGVVPSEIAVLAPKHRCLEPVIAHLNKLNIPLRYEKRENILEAPIIKQLLAMSELVIALGENNEASANALWPEVLSFEFWQIPIATIWQLSWAVSDSKGELNWSKLLTQDEKLRPIAMFMKSLGTLHQTETMEIMLDYLIGSNELEITDEITPQYLSPLRAYYTNENMQSKNPDVLYQTLSHLTVLRNNLREYQATREDTFYLTDLLHYVALYKTADERMINTSPYNQHSESVQVMTVYKAKGLEFKHVFLLDMQDEVWGESSRGNGNKLTLPANLTPIRHAGATEDERLRILFVAMTRAKIGLYLTSYRQSYSGKLTKRLKYLDEQEQADSGFKSLVLPETNQTILTGDDTVPDLVTMTTNWQSVHSGGLAQTQLRDLLQERITNYKLSPTHLNTFIDTEHGGPQVFLMNTLLRFPQAPSASGQFGNAIHETLEWLQQQLNRTARLPDTENAVEYFTKVMRSQHLSQDETERLIERGKHALNAFIAQRGSGFKANDVPEYNFSREGVLLGKALLSGKIDKLIVDRKAKTIEVIDYKTGKPHEKWESSLKLHKYKQQLYCYKILVEASHTFAGYKVIGERLEFIEPDANGKIHTLELKFNEKEFIKTKLLLQAMWQRVQTLDFPDITTYQPSLKGAIEFEDWLTSQPSA